MINVHLIFIILFTILPNVNPSGDPPEISPLYASHPRHLVEVVGGSALMPCYFTPSVQELTITAFHNDVPLKLSVSGGNKTHVRWTGDSIYIEELEESDSGNYTCVAKNSAGTIAISYQLEVYQSWFQELGFIFIVITALGVLMGCIIFCCLKGSQKWRCRHEIDIDWCPSWKK